MSEEFGRGTDGFGSGPARGSAVTIASIITVAFLGSVLVTPLYGLYQERIGFSDVTLTLVYAAYAIGNLVALLVFGQVSDQIGRKRVAMPALVLAAVGAVLFVVAAGSLVLAAARALIGLAVGVASGTGTAWLVDELGPDHRPAATLAAGTANLAGIALGPVLGGLLAEFAPHPLVLPFVVYIVLLTVVAIAVSRVRERRTPPVRRWAGVRVHPRVGVPRDIRAAFTPPAITAFVIFALGGLYFSLIPVIVARDLDNPDVAVAGLVVGGMGAAAAVTVLVGRRLSPSRAMTAGLLLALPAPALVVAAQALHSMPVLAVAAAAAGVSLGLGYRGSLQVVTAIAPDERRAEVVSGYYVCCFVGNSVPVIGVGLLARVTAPLVGSMAFAGLLAALASGALILRRRSPAQGHG